MCFQEIDQKKKKKAFSELTDAFSETRLQLEFKKENFNYVALCEVLQVTATNASISVSVCVCVCVWVCIS